MAKGRVALSPSQRRSVYEMRLAGESVEDVMAAYGVSRSTVYRAVKEEREGSEMARGEMVIAGNKRHGRLVSMGGDTYKGTCLVGNGAKSREFRAPNAVAAKEEWAAWCEQLRADEAAFLANCAPRPKEQEQPDETVTEEVAEEEVVAEEAKPAYLLWAGGDGAPRFYGLYRSMDGALAEMDKLNEVAAFLGSASTFEVEEVEWRQSERGERG